jgi:hypothetical protein
MRDIAVVQHPNQRYLGNADYGDGDLRASHNNLHDAHLDRHDGDITLPS